VNSEFVPLPPDLSLVITAHRAGPMLDVCLTSAAALDPVPREVIVSIDGSDPAVIEAAKLRGFRVVSSPDTPGVSATRNAGIKAATGDIIVFADSDVLLPKGHIARLAQAFIEHPEASAIIGSYDNTPAAPGFVSRYRNLLHHYTHQHGSPDAQTFWAGCGAIRREAFEEVGGFDESYRLPSVEDIELGYRLRQAGHHIRLVPE
jgi:GT2 family glycosyltransferase